MADIRGQDGGSAARARPAHRRVAQWMRDYARLPGIPDEYIGEDGPRPVWTRFFDAFANLSPADIERRFGAADRHLREAGVTYRPPGESADRLWPLSHLPLLIGETDWQQLSAGIAQRAELFERVLRDLYGEGRLVADGAIPAAAIAGSQRISAAGLRHQAARRALSQHLCRRRRPRTRRAMVGARRPHTGAVGCGLCAGKPPGAVARFRLALQVDECRARRALFRSFPRRAARQRRPRRAAHRLADARRIQRNLFRARDLGALSRLPAGRGR